MERLPTARSRDCCVRLLAEGLRCHPGKRVGHQIRQWQPFLLRRIAADGGGGAGHSAAGRRTGKGGAIEAFAGDIFKWLEHAIDKVKQFFVQVVGDVTHFFIQIGEKLYHFVMEAIDDVAHGIPFILNAIKVAWDKIVQWVDFIFSWNDIVRTHKVLKSIFKCYVNAAKRSRLGVGMPRASPPR